MRQQCEDAMEYVFRECGADRPDGGKRRQIGMVPAATYLEDLATLGGHIKALYGRKRRAYVHLRFSLSADIPPEAWDDEDFEGDEWLNEWEREVSQVWSGKCLRTYASLPAGTVIFAIEGFLRLMNRNRDAQRGRVGCA